MRISRRGWYPVYAFLCVCAQSMKVQSKNVYVDDSRIHDVETMSARDFDQKKGLIPIKSATTVRNNFALLPLRLEPDAEMLPAHYTGVKPPGVDHMELKYAESQILESNPETLAMEKVDHSSTKSKEFEQDKSAGYASAKQATEFQKDEGGQKKVEFEESSKGDLEKEKEKTEYSEAAGRKKVHSENEDKVKQHKDEVEGEKGATYEAEGNHGKGQKAAGYHNVYHKDEYKKDADFYGNDHHGGHFKKHGRYDEKHTAVEGTYKKGGSSDSGFDQAELSKEGISEKAQARQEAKGHDSRHGYDGFFKNFRRFGKKGGSTVGRKFGFSDSKMR